MKRKVIADATTTQLINVIVKVARDQVASPVASDVLLKRAKKILGIDGLCKSILHLVNTELKYQWDPDGEQVIPTANYTWEHRKEKKFGVDSKGYVVFISAILKACDVKHSFRFISETENKNYHHVYVVVHDTAGDIVLDPLMKKVGKEVSYKKKLDKKVYS